MDLLTEIVLKHVTSAIEGGEIDFVNCIPTRNGLALQIKDDIAHVSVYFPRTPLDNKDIGINWPACGTQGIEFTDRFITLLILATIAAEAAKGFAAVIE